MLQFNSLELNNYVTFKRFFWPMDKYKLLVVRGKNLDRAREDSANAVGKSLLHGSISTLLLDAPTISVKQHAAKSMLLNKASATINLTKNKENWQFTQFNKNNSVKYQVFHKQIDQQIERVPDARKTIAQVFPLSSAHVYSQMILTPARPSILLIGTGVNRLNYFKEVFNLSIYDLMRRKLRAELNKIAASKNLQASLLSQRKSIKPLKPIKIDLVNIKQRYAQLLSDMRAGQKQIEKLTWHLSLCDQLHSQATHDELALQLKAFKKKLNHATQAYDKLTAQLYQAKTNNKKYQKQTKLLAKLKHIPKVKTIDDKSKLDKKIQQLTKQLDKYNEYVEHIKRYHKIKNQAHDNFVNPNKLQTKLIKTKHVLSQHNKLQKYARCPTCNSQINKKTVSQHLTQLKKQVKQLERKLLQAKINLFCQKITKLLPSHIINLNHQAAVKKLDQLKQTQHKIIKLNRQKQKRKLLLAQLKSFSGIKRVNIKKIQQQWQSYKQQCHKYADRIEQIRHDLKLLDKLAQSKYANTDITQLKQTLHKLKHANHQMSDKFEKIQDQLAKANQHQADYQSQQKLLVKLDEQIKECEQATENLDLLQALQEAYSSKGMQNEEIALRAELYIQKLNMLSSSIFAEPTKFYCQIKGNNCDILVERHKHISDIRQLSDSERPQFMIISALSLISQMPDSYRVSHMFLDEIEANMSPHEQILFAKEFIPILTASVPNLVIITPQSSTQMAIDNANEMLLTRQGGITNATFN